MILMWDERYQTDNYVYGKQANDFLVEVLSQLPKGDLLTLGEGEGRNAVYLAREQFNVTAIDGSAVGLAKAKKLADENNVNLNLRIEDLSEFEVAQNKWDVIVSIFCHLPSSLRIPLYSKLIASLKPGGYFVLEAYSPEQLTYKTGGPPNIDMLVDLPELESHFHQFDRIICQKTERNIEEGKLHNGNASVVQLLAQKT